MDKEFFTVPVTSQSSDEVTFADTVFGFWDSSDSISNHNDNDDDNDNDDNIFIEKNNKTFWEEQDQLLKGILCRTSSRETKVREATKEVVGELKVSEMVCICQRQVVAKSCRNCFLREICDRLLNLGYNCAICKSKWRSSPQIPSGEHTYLEVTDNSSNTKRGAVKVVIELSFRAEFEMARANEEYNQLVKRLPEVFVGKSERLRALVKIMCSAAKTCMKENKMHIAPWRKHKYMQAKWFGTCVRSTVEPLPITYSTKQQKPKASLLTFDLLDSIHGLHCAPVEVV
ncbi:uncharacterized protein LOC109816868 [Cajanus cajan]|uniref:Uncharacterized protein n=1 Tax=Cajanus cajan TaxID=3821 RepID=A0A151RPT3_CAJCA|nr:uncharacterized protein LOC109816868 [Cajanus cajan]KYP44550.1 hypothetical protein KK1_033951 [Cajanus cajan]